MITLDLWHLLALASGLVLLLSAWAVNFLTMRHWKRKALVLADDLATADAELRTARRFREIAQRTGEQQRARLEAAHADVDRLRALLATRDDVDLGRFLHDGDPLQARCAYAPEACHAHPLPGSRFCRDHVETPKTARKIPTPPKGDGGVGRRSGGSDRDERGSAPPVGSDVRYAPDGTPYVLGEFWAEVTGRSEQAGEMPWQPPAVEDIRMHSPAEPSTMDTTHHTQAPTTHHTPDTTPTTPGSSYSDSPGGSTE